MIMINDRIKKRRTELGLSQAALAKKVGVSREAVSQWESGAAKGLRPDNLLACAKALQCNIEWLINGSSSEPTPPHNGDIGAVSEQANGVSFEIDPKVLEQALAQLDDELPGWQELTPQRRSRLIMTFYEDIYAPDEDEDQGIRDSTS